jgi:hypothetical protein
MKILRALLWFLAISFVALVFVWLFSASANHSLWRAGSPDTAVLADTFLFAGALLVIISILLEPIIARWFGRVTPRLTRQKEWQDDQAL